MVGFDDDPKTAPNTHLSYVETEDWVHDGQLAVCTAFWELSGSLPHRGLSALLIGVEV